MKHLYILRHCEYDERSGPGPNFDCHLSPEGMNHARKIGKTMASNHIQPDVIYCSGSKRTRETLDALLESINKPEIIFNDEIYGCMPGDLLDIIQNTEQRFSKAMIIGHNPAMHGIVQILGQNSDTKYLQEISYFYGTGMLSVFDHNNDNWGEASPTSCQISALYS